MLDDLHFQKYECANSSAWLVLIHGLFGDSDNLASVRRHFESRINLLSVDLPNHGKSPHVDQFQLEDCVTRLIQTLDHQGINQFALLGHSLGGKVAMLTALHYPQRVTQLVIADIAPVDYPPRHQAVFSGLQAVDLASLTSRKQADEQMATYIREPGVRQFLLKGLYQNDRQQWQWRFNLAGLINSYSSVTHWPASDLQYDGPTLFIKGSESDYISQQHRSEIAKYFPRARAHILEGAGHWLHAEKPRLFNKVVEKNLLNLP